MDTAFYGEGVSPTDWDGDGTPAPLDVDLLSAENLPDSDSDGVFDFEDTDTLDPYLWGDFDRNGVNADAQPEGSDTDNDGVSDLSDSHPLDLTLANDWNYDGVNDEQQDPHTDGVTTLQDSHPHHRYLWCDWNRNGMNDELESLTITAPTQPEPTITDSDPSKGHSASYYACTDVLSPRQVGS